MLSVNSVTKKSFSQSRSASTQSNSYLQQRRREQNKKGFVVAPDTDAPLFKFPNERLGNEYSLNWTFVKYGIPPQGTNAFRNLHSRHLAMYCEGTADAFKAIHIGTPADSPVTHYVVRSEFEPTTSQACSPISSEQWKLLMFKVTKHLSESENLFMTDGAFGSHRDIETKVRVITKDASTALYLKHFLIPTSGTTKEFGSLVNVYHAPDIQIPNPAKYGLKEGPFVVHMLMKGSEALKTIDRKNNYVDEITDQEASELSERLVSIVIVGGVKSLSGLKEHITQASSFFQLHGRCLPLPGSTIVADGKSTLVLDSGSNLSASDAVFSYGNTIWGPQGLYKAYNGLTHQNVNANRDRSDLVEKIGDKTFVHTSVKNDNIIAPNPSNIVFVVSDKSLPDQKTLNVEEAKKYFATLSASSLNIEPELEVSKNGFAALLETSKPQIFVVNSHSKSSEQINQVISQIAGLKKASSSAPQTSTPTSTESNNNNTEHKQTKETKKTKPVAEKAPKK